MNDVTVVTEAQTGLRPGWRDPGCGAGRRRTGSVQVGCCRGLLLLRLAVEAEPRRGWVGSVEEASGSELVSDTTWR